MQITQFSVQEIKDPTNIIEGERYEFIFDVEVPEDDELHTEVGLEVRAIIGKNEDDVRMLNYFIMDKGSKDYFDFALEDDEEQMFIAACKEELAK